jgi:hypothetical protein
VDRICFVQTLQVVKVNCPESNEDSINAQPEGKTKFLFPTLLPDCLVKLRENSEKLRKFFKETEAKQLRPESRQWDLPTALPTSFQDC